jgi:hypothetical protein
MGKKNGVYLLSPGVNAWARERGETGTASIHGIVCNNGAALPRLDAHRNMVSTDFRVAVPLTTRQGPWEAKSAVPDAYRTPPGA